MPIFWPTYTAKKVSDITHHFLKENGVKGLVIDIDNTLATHGNPEPHDEAENWIHELTEKGYHVVLLSNNSALRAQPFAQRLGVACISDAGKPWGKGVAEAREKAGNENVLLVGDQVFTDVLAGKRWGMKTVLVEPLHKDYEWFIIFKRYLEKIVLLGCNRKKRRIDS